MVCPSWLSFILYNPVRKFLTDREKVLAESGVTGGSVVLEVGAGNGFFTEVLAGKAEKVYAVELQEGMLGKLRRRVAPYGDRVVVVRGNIADISLPPGFFDVAFVYYAFHEIEGKAEGAGNIGRALKKKGIVAVYEPTVEVGRKEMDRTEKTFEAAGFETEVRRDGLFTRFLRMRKR